MSENNQSTATKVTQLNNDDLPASYHPYINPRAERWIRALESGEYDQVMGSLKKTSVTSDKPAYCCLGVACELDGLYTGDDIKWMGKATYNGKDHGGYLPGEFESNKTRGIKTLGDKGRSK